MNCPWEPADEKSVAVDLAVQSAMFQKHRSALHSNKHVAD